MIGLTTEVSTDTMLENPKMVEVTLSYIYSVNGKVIEKMLKFFVSQEQFDQQYNNTVDLASV